MEAFTREPLHIDDIVVYLKNEDTSSSTTRKCKFIGQIVDFTKSKVKIHRFSKPDIFIHPEEIEDLGVDVIYPYDVVHIIDGKYDNDMTKTLEQVIELVNKYKAELEFTRNFIHEHGLEFELASAWDKRKDSE